VNTDDRLELETVHALGGHVQHCEQFIRAVRGAMEELQRNEAPQPATAMPDGSKT
jgi:hypothetical protein